MTILKKILSFDIPKKDVDCCYCKGTGKIKTTRTNAHTTTFCFIIGIFTVMSILSFMFEHGLTNLLLSIIFTPLAIMCMLEYKQQTINYVKKNK